VHILYIHQYFLTPDEPGGTRSYWLAKELIRNGHKVTMLTATNKFSESIKRISVDEIDVIYLKEEYNQNMSVPRRLIAFMSFMFKALFVGFRLKKVDLVFATSTPLTVGIPALVLKWIKRIPFIFEVRDLWPEVPIQMKAINNVVLIWLTRGLEKLIYTNARHVIALSPGMQEGVIKYISASKTSMIPNMAKTEAFWPREKSVPIQMKLKLNPNSFKVIHFGSLGKANGINSIIESLKLMTEIHDVEFLFVGAGSTELELQSEIERSGLSNVKLLGKFAMKDLSEIVNFSDVSMISFLDLPILYTNSPNKLFDSLSAGKPILVNSAGWTKDIAEKYKCGFYVNPNEPQDLVDKILYLKRNPQVLSEMGKNSRILAETVYDKSILTKQVVKICENESSKTQ
jgi:glycosyltransferase involved in cell wall biosynthesis